MNFIIQIYNYLITKKTDNIDEIIKKAKEKTLIFDNKVNEATIEIDKKLKEKGIFVDSKETKPFAELLANNKENLKIVDKVQQKVSPVKAVKICEALQIKNCFENSVFDEYKKEQEEKRKKSAAFEAGAKLLELFMDIKKNTFVFFFN